MAKERDRWLLFNALLDVAEEEKKKYEMEKREAREKERSLRENFPVLLKPAHQTGKEDSPDNDSKRAAKRLDLCVYQKGKRLHGTKVSSTETVKKLSPPPNSEGNHQGKDGNVLLYSDEIVENSANRSGEINEEETPSFDENQNSCDIEKKSPPDKSQLPNFDGNHKGKDGNVLFSYGDIIKKSSKRLRDTDGEEMPMPKPKKPKKVNLEKPRKKKANKVNLDGPKLPLPETFKNKIKALGGSESQTIFVFQKVLTPTDVSSHQSRLLIPFKQVEDHNFLTVDERDLLGKRYLADEEAEAVKIPAIFIDPECNECRMNLTRWDMQKGSGNASRNYSLVTYWKTVVRQSSLKEGGVVQLWGFRRGSELGLALVKI